MCSWVPRVFPLEISTTGLVLRSMPRLREGETLTCCLAQSIGTNFAKLSSVPNRSNPWCLLDPPWSCWSSCPWLGWLSLCRRLPTSLVKSPWSLLEAKFPNLKRDRTPILPFSLSCEIGLGWTSVGPTQSPLLGPNLNWRSLPSHSAVPILARSSPFTFPACFLSILISLPLALFFFRMDVGVLLAFLFFGLSTYTLALCLLSLLSWATTSPPEVEDPSPTLNFPLKGKRPTKLVFWVFFVLVTTIHWPYASFSILVSSFLRDYSFAALLGIWPSLETKANPKNDSSGDF